MPGQRGFLRVLPPQRIDQFCLHTAEVTGSNPVAPTQLSGYAGEGDDAVRVALPPSSLV